MLEASTLLASSFGSLSPLANTMVATCTLNGRAIDCPNPGVLFGVFASFLIVFAIIFLVLIISNWKIYSKAGKPGWTSIIPIYNMVVLLEIVGKPIWWIILMFVPFVNVVIGYLVVHELARVFGKGIGYTLGLIFLPFIFYPILGFGKAVYTKPTMTV